MKTNFDPSVVLVIQHEGGYDDDPRDSGNWTGGTVGVGELKGTKFGIDCASYPELDIVNLTIDEAKIIYKNDYWDEVQGDELPAGVDYATMDFGVNSGVGSASKYLQQIVGSPVDGVIGPHTLACVTQMDSATIVNLICNNRAEFLKGIGTFPIYGKGWLSRVEDVRRVSLQMIKGGST